MLTSEKAALARVRMIYKDLKKRKVQKFLDVDFGPKDKNDFVRNKLSLYTDGNPPQKGYVTPEEIEWVYYDELCTPGEKLQFVDDGPSSNDCKQGDLGDCWFISALGVIANRDELLMGGKRGLEYSPGMIVDKDIATLLSNGVYPPIFHRYRSRGLFVFRIFKNFKWIYVIVDERIPIKIKDRKPVFGSCSKS